MCNRVSTVLAQPDTNQLVVKVSLQDSLFCRRCTCNGATHLQLWHRNSHRTAKHRGPCTGSTQHDGCSDSSVLGNDRRNPACLGLDSSHGTGCQNPCTTAHCRPCDRWRHQVGLGPAITRRIHRTVPLCRDLLRQLAQFSGIYNFRVEFKFLCGLYPVVKVLQSAFTVCRKQATALRETNTFANLRFQFAEDSHAFEHHRKFPGVTALLSNPAPVAP